MGGHNLTSRRTDLVAQNLKYYGHSWNALAKSVVKVLLYNCLLLKAMTAFVSSARSGARVIYYSQCQNYYIHWLFLLFLFIARSSGNYNVFFFFLLVGWKWLICQCFMQNSSFMHKLNLLICIETQLISIKYLFEKNLPFFFFFWKFLKVNWREWFV